MVVDVWLNIVGNCYEYIYFSEKYYNIKIILIKKQYYW